MRAALFGLALLTAASAALAQDASPFAPPAPAKPKILRLLAPANAIDPAMLEMFERESGYEVAYDSYVGAPGLAERWREGPYDLAMLPGPALARYAAGGALQKLDRAQAPNARAVSPALAAKLAAYDPGGRFAVAADWAATGLVFDAGKAAKALGAAPNSWAALFAPDAAARLRDCGIALPDQRDELFIAALRYLGVDPNRPREIDVAAAAGAILRTRLLAKFFAAPDTARLLASGSACITLGGEALARFAYRASASAGVRLNISFLLPREGGPMAIDTFAIPADARQSAQAYALLDFLLRPAVMAGDASYSGMNPPNAGGRDADLKTLWPVGAFSPPLEALVAGAWERLRGLDKAPKPVPKPKIAAKRTKTPP